MSETKKAKIEQIARGTAVLFYEAFSVPFDPEETDWEGVAWEVDSRAIDVDYYDEEAFKLYSRTLQSETEFLATGERP